MNLIVLALDSFRQDHVSCYHQGNAPFEGVAPCQTPHLDAFARQSVAFHNVYPEALPTIPIRMQWMTGQRTLPYRPWEPLSAHDVTVAQILRREGYVCGLVSDTYHYRAPGMNYHQHFHSYTWVRGQEYDPYESAPTRRNIDDYVNGNFPEPWRNRIAQFLANTDDLTREEERFPAQVVRQAVRWLEKNRDHGKVFLWVDSFDPHEPWDPPEAWDTYGDPNYSGKRLIMPMGGMADDWASAEEQRRIQSLYAGEAAFVDHCLEPFFAALERLGYLEDSIVLVMGDHGHPLGDHGKFLKGADRMYNELLKVPFLLHLPGGRGSGEERQALIQFHDVLPTLLDFMGLGNNASSMHGNSFRSVIEGADEDLHEAVITGYHQGIDRCIRDRRWSFIHRPEGETDELYDLQADPRERTNLVDEHPEEAQRLASHFGSYFYRFVPRHIKGIQGRYELASGATE